MASVPPTRKKKVKWRPWLRAIHRDIGYFAVGLTFVYAFSGLAVNHIADWDPNFNLVEETHQLGKPVPAEDEAAAKLVLTELGLQGPTQDVYAVDETQLDVVLENRTLHVNRKTGEVLEEGQEPRWFLRVANWLHLNRGKKAWTIVADSYAAFLIYLATSGLFMIPGRKGLVGRGAIIAVVGALVPTLYVVLSGGP